MNAQLARNLTHDAQKNSFDKAIEDIERAAKIGWSLCDYMQGELSLEAVTKLIELGFAVSKFEDKNFQRWNYRISW